MRGLGGKCTGKYREAIGRVSYALFSGGEGLKRLILIGTNLFKYYIIILELAISNITK